MLGADMTACAPRDHARPARSPWNAHHLGWRTMLAAATVATLFGVTSPPAWAASCDETTNPITISETQQISYGTIAVTNGGGTVTISTTGGVTAPGGFTVSGVTSAGSFHVTGKQNCAVLIS